MKKANTKKACVIGHPIGHTRSPLIHGYWLEKYGIGGTYEKKDVAPENLPAFFATLIDHGYSGCNITLPHKEAAAKLIRNTSSEAAALGSVNTAYVENGQLHATSTDGEGFYQNLLSVTAFDPVGKKIVILGAGGSAKAIAGYFNQLKCREIVVANRTLAKAQDLAKIFGARLRAISEDELKLEFHDCDLLIHTTTQGMNGKNDPVLPLNLLPRSAIVADIVYVPLKTRLVNDAEALGLKAVSGLGMLLHQAVKGFELWFGVRPEVTQDLYDLVARDIDPDYSR